MADAQALDAGDHPARARDRRRRFWGRAVVSWRKPSSRRLNASCRSSIDRWPAPVSSAPRPSGQRLQEGLGARLRGQAVGVAHDDQRRDRDVLQGVPQVQVDQAPDRVRPHLGRGLRGDARDVGDLRRRGARTEVRDPRGEVGEVRSGRLHAPAYPVDPLQVRHEPAPGRPDQTLHPHPHAAHRLANEVRGGGVDQDDARHASPELLRVPVGQGDDRHPAHAVAHQDGRPLRHRRVQHRAEISRQGLHRVVAGGRGSAAPVSALVVQHAPVSLGQRVPLVVPQRQVQGHPVREHHRRRVLGTDGAHVQGRSVEARDRRRLPGKRVERDVPFGIGTAGGPAHEQPFGDHPRADPGDDPRGPDGAVAAANAHRSCT